MRRVHLIDGLTTQAWRQFDSSGADCEDFRLRQTVFYDKERVELNRTLAFVPAYRCEKQISRVIQQFSGPLAEAIDTLLVIDNRSPDNTIDVAKQHLQASPVRRRVLVRNCENYGLGGSQKVGFRYAIEHGFTRVMILHGDDQGSASDILPMLRDERPCCGMDALLGSRFSRGSVLSGYSTFRTLGNQLFNLLFSGALRHRIFDLGSGLNLYRTAVFADGFHLKFPDDLTFNYCLVMAHVHFKHRIQFAPISWREDDQISNVKLFSQARKVLQLLARFSINPADFMATDHRTVPRSEYPFEVLFQSID